MAFVYLLICKKKKLLTEILEKFVFYNNYK